MSLARCCMPSMRSTPPVGLLISSISTFQVRAANDQPDFRPANDHRAGRHRGDCRGGVPQIQLNGGSAGSGANGLTFGSGSSGSSVQGLVILGFGSYGIDITSSSSGDSVLGCWIGLASGLRGYNGTGFMSVGRARRSAGPRPAPVTSYRETAPAPAFSSKHLPGRGQRNRHECGRHGRRRECLRRLGRRLERDDRRDSDRRRQYDL